MQVLFVANSFANVFADCCYAVHTHQLEFANTSLPTLVFRVKAALGIFIDTSSQTFFRNCLQKYQGKGCCLSW